MYPLCSPVDPVLVQLRVEEPAVAVEAHPGVVAGARRAVVAHVPLADVRGLVAELLQGEVVVRAGDGESASRATLSMIP